jgi:hypothetical protein
MYCTFLVVNNGILFFWWPKTCFMKCTPHCVGAHYHLQVLTQRIPHIAVDYLPAYDKIFSPSIVMGFYTHSLLRKGDASWAPSSWRLHMTNSLPTGPTTCRLRDTQQFWHVTFAMPMLQHGYSISTSSPMVMLSWAKKTFTIIKENVLRDHITDQKWEEEP